MIKLATLALPLLLLSAGATSARAGFVPIFSSASFASGATTFTYNLSFSTNGGSEILTSGSFVTLYDVYNPTATTFSATATQGNIAVSTSAVGLTAPFTGPTDSASLNNVTFTYTDGPQTTDTSFLVSFSLTGNFVGQLRSGQYSSVNSTAAGTNGQIGAVMIPVTVPEPSALALSVLGLGLAYGLRRRRTMAV